jgi:hypothetical protein
MVSDIRRDGFQILTAIPFNRYGVSGFSRAISTLEKMQIEANVNEDGYSVS